MPGWALRFLPPRPFWDPLILCIKCDPYTKILSHYFNTIFLLWGQGLRLRCYFFLNHLKKCTENREINLITPIQKNKMWGKKIGLHWEDVLGEEAGHHQKDNAGKKLSRARCPPEMRPGCFPRAWLSFGSKRICQKKSPAQRSSCWWGQSMGRTPGQLKSDTGLTVCFHEKEISFSASVR